MDTAIRRAAAADAAECGRIICEAFGAIADQHNFPRDFPSVEIATRVAAMLIAHPSFYGVVAERDGRILGSNFMDERSPIGGVGPITVDPASQNTGIGRQLMGPSSNAERRASCPAFGWCRTAFTIVLCASTRGSVS